MSVPRRWLICPTYLLSSLPCVRGKRGIPAFPRTAPALPPWTGDRYQVSPTSLTSVLTGTSSVDSPSLPAGTYVVVLLAE
jgi:hypothetical protein